MKGKVISLHDGFHLDVIQGDSIPPKAVVRFENGMALVVDERMRWEGGLARHDHCPSNCPLSAANCPPGCGLVIDTTMG